MQGKREPMNLADLREKLREDKIETEGVTVEPVVEPMEAPRRRRRRRYYEASDTSSRLTIPEGTETIEESAYRNRAELVTVVLPKTLKYIGKGAFEDCKNLREIVFPEGLKLIDDRAFKDCRSLEKVVIPGSVERVGAFAFCRCESLEELKIMDGVRQLGRWAFADCYALTNFHKRDLPRSLSKTMQLADTRVVPTWTEAFYGSPCARTVEDKRRQKAARKWNEKMIMLQRIM